MKQNSIKSSEKQIILYKTPNGNVKMEVFFSTIGWSKHDSQLTTVKPRHLSSKQRVFFGVSTSSTSPCSVLEVSGLGSAI